MVPACCGATRGNQPVTQLAQGVRRADDANRGAQRTILADPGSRRNMEDGGGKNQSHSYSAPMDSPATCTDAAVRPNVLQLAALVALIIIVAYVVRRKCMKDKFVSERAQQVFNGAKPLFEQTEGKPAYSAYKTHVPGADPVQYADLKKLWKDGKFTPENVETNL